MKSDARDGDSEWSSGTTLAGTRAGSAVSDAAGAGAGGAGMLMPSTVGQSTDR